ncbi:MAG: hydroxyectoine utilization dehydratase EutB [Chloroflexia bacterium]
MVEGAAASQGEPTLNDVLRAREAVGRLARRTPLLRFSPLDERIGRAVYLKLENLQETGSFKVRGAANRIAALSPEERARGVVTVSTGNHARAVAWVACRFGIPATVCMSRRVPPGKVQAVRALGAEVRLVGESYDEAALECARLEREQGLTYIPPFDDPWVIAGQGTIGLEILDDSPEIDTAVVPLSGGGLISGIALALKSVRPEVRVIGVSQDRAPVMACSLKAGRPIELPEEETLADALAGGIGLHNRYTFRLVQRLVDDVVLVSEEEIAAAIVFALQALHLVVEGGGAVGLAALLQGRICPLGRHIAVVLSGGNIDLERLQEIIAQHGPSRGGVR